MRLQHISQPVISVTHTGHDWQTLIDEFISSLDLSSTTCRAYRSCLKKWLVFNERMSFPSVTAPEKSSARIIPAGGNNHAAIFPDTRAVVAYKRYLQNQNLSAYSVGLCLTSLRMFLEYLVTSGYIQYNPAQAVRGVKRPKSLRSSLTKDEADKLLALEFSHSRKDRRNKTILYLRLFTGLRAISIARADIADIKTNPDRRLLYYRGKGKDFKDSFVILTPRIWQTVEAYLKDAVIERGPLFTAINSNNRLSCRAIYDITRSALQRAGITRQDIQPHSLRHTAVTFSILGGADISQAQQMAGHHDLETTAGYFHDIRRTQDPAEEHIETYLASK